MPFVIKNSMNLLIVTLQLHDVIHLYYPCSPFFSAAESPTLILFASGSRNFIPTEVFIWCLRRIPLIYGGAGSYLFEWKRPSVGPRPWLLWYRKINRVNARSGSRLPTAPLHRTSLFIYWPLRLQYILLSIETSLFGRNEFLENICQIYGARVKLIWGVFADLGRSRRGWQHLFM